MDLKISDETMQQAISAAILNHIGPEARDELIKRALAEIMEGRKGPYGEKRSSIVQEAFGQACASMATDTIRRLVYEDPQVRAQIEEFARKAITHLLSDPDDYNLVHGFASAFRKVMSGER